VWNNALESRHGWRIYVDQEMQIRSIINRIAKMPLEIQQDESLFESGLLDSFMLVDLIGGIEEEFGIKIPDSDLIPQKFDSVSKIAQYLSARSSR
jgi:acyl carrier protein